MVISMLKIRRPLGRLIFNMGIAIPGKTVFLIETAPWLLFYIAIMPYYPHKASSRSRKKILLTIFRKKNENVVFVYKSAAREPAVDLICLSGKGLPLPKK